MKFSNLRRKFIKKATYTTPLLLSLGSLTKPQVAGGSHLAIPPIQIPNTFRRNAFAATNRDSANYNPLFNPVDEWLQTTRFWGGGLYRSGARGLTSRTYYNFDADEEAKYLNTYGFAKIQYDLLEPIRYEDGCTFFFRGFCLGDATPGYRSYRNSPRSRPTDPILTDARELTYGEYLLTRSFEQNRSQFQANGFSTIIRYSRHRDVRRKIGLDGINNVDQLRAQYDLASYNYYTREILGHEFDLVSLEQAREWSAGGDDVDLVIKKRMDQLSNYDRNYFFKGGGHNIGTQTVEDVLNRIRTIKECQSIEAVFSQLCGDFDPYGDFDPNNPNF